MKEYPILKNAPVSEALIDVRLALAKDFDVKHIDSIHKSINSEYPEKHHQKVSEFTVDEGVKIKPLEPKINGYRYISPDKKQVFQARLNGFTFSRLHPYIEWNALYDEAFRLWSLYRDITNPISITRVALRYINNLKIPMPIKDFSDYLTAPPLVPEELPQSVSNFLTRIIIYDQEFQARAIITQALDQLTSDVAPVILDIDVFKMDPKGIDEDEAWETIRKLRYFKNKIFFSSITDRLKEMYK